MVVIWTKLTCLYRLPTQHAHKSDRRSVIGQNVPFPTFLPPTSITSYPIWDYISSSTAESTTSNTKRPLFATNHAPIISPIPSGICPILGFPTGTKFLSQYFSDFWMLFKFGIFKFLHLLDTNSLHLLNTRVIQLNGLWFLGSGQLADIFVVFVSD
jgi:hypothetical protein